MTNVIKIDNKEQDTSIDLENDIDEKTSINLIETINTLKSNFNELSARLKSEKDPTKLCNIMHAYAQTASTLIAAEDHIADAKNNKNSHSFKWGNK